MTIEDFIPAERLRPFIKAYRIIESTDELENRVLPSTSLAIAFRFKGQNSYTVDTGKHGLPSIAFSGLRRSVRLINYSTNTSTLVVLFKEGGASAFFKEPLHELFENSIPLEYMISPNELAAIEESLSEAQNHVQRVAVIEQFFLKRLNCFKQDKLILEAVAKIHGTNGVIKIRELANSLYISNDAFEKRFRKIVGASPKQFASIVRMLSVIGTTTHERFFDMAFDAGYYDQAHFNKDFKLFTGQAPTDFFNSASYW